MELGYRVGFPINLEEFEFKEIPDEDIMKAVKVITKPGETINNI